MDLSKRLDSIELKIRQLASKLDRLTQENEQLLAENHQLKTDLDRQQGLVSALKDKLERTQREMDERRYEADEPDRASIRQQIDHYLREIDKCIDWLEQKQ